MNFKLLTLKLQCKHSIEVLSFSPQVSSFHGEISAGKSSIVRLIDFCLGGNLEPTTAIKSELVSVELSTYINGYDVLFERNLETNNKIQVTWKKDDLNASVLAPLKATNKRIWGDAIYSFSDLMFYFLDITPIKVRRSKLKNNSPLIRLSFRDIMKYCYLDQKDIDSSFFKMEDPFRKLKSRDVMRFLMGYYTERLNNLELKLEEVEQLLLGKREAITQIKDFLKQLNYDSELEVAKEIDSVREELNSALAQQTGVREQYQVETHFTDELKEQLRSLGKQLDDDKQALFELRERTEEERSLKAELVSIKLKLAQSESVSSIFHGVFFEFCPACRTPTDNYTYADDHCYLCGREPQPANNMSTQQLEVAKHDLASQVAELEESIKSRVLSAQKQELLIRSTQEEKNNLDAQLKRELDYYDSVFLARFREVERRVATYEERLRGLDKVTGIVQTVNEIEEAIFSLTSEKKKLEQQIQEEKNSLNHAERNIASLESNFLEALLAVKTPDVRDDYEISINQKTWIPYILPGGDEAMKWSFGNAGSGGKKTLFNVCYALALHKTASENNLPLPNFLIIDTPMKNIGEDVNRNIFVAFYNYLYSLVENSLSETQIIIVDKEYLPPSSSNINIFERFMTPTDEQDPPLIRYYRSDGSSSNTSS